MDFTSIALLLMRGTYSLKWRWEVKGCKLEEGMVGGEREKGEGGGKEESGT